MKSRGYWIGFVLLITLAMAPYLWPRAPMVTINYRVHELESSSLEPAEEVDRFRTRLVQQDIQFPEGSSLAGFYQNLAVAGLLEDTLFKGNVMTGISMRNTLREHQKALDLGLEVVLSGLDSDPELAWHFTTVRGEQLYGISEHYWTSFDDSFDLADLRSNYHPKTTIYFGSPIKGITFPFHRQIGPLTISDSRRTITYNNRAWPLLLFLALAPYTLLFALRPLRRGIAGLFRWRKRDTA